jgi:hypothetical protein
MPAPEHLGEGVLLTMDTGVFDGRWFEVYLAPADMIALRSALEPKSAHDRLVRELASPPPGWFTFGHHAGQEAADLEFWGTGEDGLPIWERPRL